MSQADEDNPNKRKRLSRHFKKLKRPQITRRFVERGASRITEVEVDEVFSRADDIRSRFSREGPLGDFLDDVDLLLSLLGDYKSGAYRQVPYFAIGAIAFGLLYVVNPLDLIPDVVPGLGQIDDAAVLAACMILVRQELSDYETWRAARDGHGPSAPAAND